MTKRKLSYQDVCCQVCGNYAPGDEEYDFCDHKRGRGCAYNSDDNEPSMAEMYPLELDDDPDTCPIENPCHEWEPIWEDGELVCCVCMICGEYKIFVAETEESGR